MERFSGGLIDQIVTDNRGRFRFPNLQRGYYKVVVNAPGYRPVQQDADLQVLARVFLVFELTADASKSLSGAPLLIDVVDARVPAAAREAFSAGRAALSKKSYKEAIAQSSLVFWSMLSFISILMVGYVYALKKGALDWKK